LPRPGPAFLVIDDTLGDDWSSVQKLLNLRLSSAAA
jgi:hypothetical protein